MNLAKRVLIVALLLPIAALLTLSAYKQYILIQGAEVILPISGYDPRDILAGHYLIYQVDYDVPYLCSANDNIQDAYICLEPKSFSYSEPTDCARMIRGACHANRFVAGIEKYYIPESEAKNLDKLIRNKQASIVVSVTRDGSAQVKDLLIDGKPWGME